METSVVIAEYNPEWPLRFQREERILREVLGGRTIAIEHIGSTSVEGLGAKPTIDIMVGVEELTEVDEWVEPLRRIGYEHVVHREFPSRRFFRKGQWRAGTDHLHIYKYRGLEWNNNILFRDYLIKHPEVRRQYDQLKKELAEKHRNDRAAYTNAKHPFITDIIEKAKRG
ncbi:GrpB family protein [Paenibacillus oenotherae]|uniref:GrpB family protein n=1 Tax=Paenibacillus oenotherae TaxID=1435645 RepID=A0ABS7D4L2_9BACL|nr:GrpB family protein [Paenibacillus oenotherae]MBW7474733.1 GrpB family protein [Paenibacillus oenotherae]